MNIKLKKTQFILIIFLTISQKKLKIKKMLKDIEKYCVNYSNFIKIGFGSNGIVYRVINKKNGYYVE